MDIIVRHENRLVGCHLNELGTLVAVLGMNAEDGILNNTKDVQKVVRELREKSSLPFPDDTAAWYAEHLIDTWDATGTPLVSFSMQDISYDMAFRAHTGTSFVPEIRAENCQSGYVQDIAQTVKYFHQFVTSENRAEMSADLEEYRQRYIQKYSAVLSAKSNCLSTMIAGPSNFNVRRAEKANRSEDNRYKEFADWKAKALARMNATYNPRVLANKPISSDDADACDKLREKIAKLERHQTTMKTVNKILRSKKLLEAEKIEQVAPLGIPEKLAVDMLHPQRPYDVGFQSFDLTNNGAVIRSAKQRLIELERRRQEVTKEIEISDVRVMDNVEENRVQIFFPGKPDAPVRDFLKKTWVPMESTCRCVAAIPVVTRY